MKPLKILFILKLILSNYLIYGQVVKYYGYDTMYAYMPSDIIETHNGDFIIIGDIAQSEYQVCIFQIQKYLVRTDYKGDTLLTKKHVQNYFGGGNVIEKADSSLVFLGHVYGSNSCGTIYTPIPFQDYALIHYSSECDSLATIPMSDTCDDILEYYIKNDSGGISALHYSRDLFVTPNNDHSIKEISRSGQIQSIPLGKSINFSFLEKNTNGYWLVGQNKLKRIDLVGDSMWQVVLALPSPYISYFCKVEDDNLIFGVQEPFPIVNHFTKTDSIGNIIWDKSYDITPKHIMMHSTGNYIITGYNSNNHTKVLAINLVGDSIWSRTHQIDYMEPLKTIEADDGRLITLAWADTNQVWNRLKAMYAVIFDSLDYVLQTPILNKEKRSEAVVFPNPSTGLLKLKLINFTETNNYQAEIFNSLGQLVYQDILKNELSSFDIRHFPKGVYIVSIRDSKSIITHQKIVLED